MLVLMGILGKINGKPEINVEEPFNIRFYRNGNSKPEW